MLCANSSVTNTIFGVMYFVKTPCALRPEMDLFFSLDPAYVIANITLASHAKKFHWLSSHQSL
jgi:hypothetical protein